MTVTIRHLSGTREPLDIVIAAHLLDNWVNTNITGSVTPSIEPLTYIPSMTAEEDNTTSPNTIKISSVNRYRVPEDEPNGDDSHVWYTDVVIDIWAESIVLLQEFEDEVNRILWEIRPNEATRLKKSDGNDPPVVGSDNSEVERFKEDEINFEFLGADNEQFGAGQIVSSTGTLICVWFKTKT